MTNNDQQVIKSGQTQGVIENWTFDPPIDEKLPDKFICVVFDNDILRLLMTTNDQKVVNSGQTGFDRKMNFRPINRLSEIAW